MKIAFVGKGGSGKTTVASLFAMQMAHDGHAVLAFDADINQHLAEAIGITDPLPSMGLRQSEIKKHLAGTNARFTPETMQKTTPPGAGSRFVRAENDDWFIKTFTKTSPDGVRLAGAGEIPDGNIGVKCYHGLNGAVEMVVGHFIDKPNDIVIVDMTAGADAFSSSLFAKVDALALVIEPTNKSLAVYEQFKEPATKYGVPLLIIANKVADDADRDFLLSHVAHITAWISPSAFVKNRDRGRHAPISKLEPEIADQLRLIHSAAARIGRDWSALQRRMNQMHLKNAEGWMGEAAKKHIDPTFSLESQAMK